MGWKKKPQEWQPIYLSPMHLSIPHSCKRAWPVSPLQLIALLLHGAAERSTRVSTDTGHLAQPAYFHNNPAWETPNLLTEPHYVSNELESYCFKNPPIDWYESWTAGPIRSCFMAKGWTCERLQWSYDTQEGWQKSAAGTVPLTAYRAVQKVT